MAVATGISAGIGIVGGVSKFFEGQQMQRDAENSIKNFEWKDLQNPFENQQVSTLGSDLKTEQANIGAASNTEALRQGGQRALVAGLGQVEANRNNVNRENAANLDQQQADINKNIAVQAVNNQNMMETRQTNELQGYGQKLNVGMGMKYDAIGNVANAIGAGGAAASSMIPSSVAGSGVQMPYATGVTNAITPAGLAPYQTQVGGTPSIGATLPFGG